MKGRIIAVEGRDGAGKSTTAKIVAGNHDAHLYLWKDGRLSKMSKRFDHVSPFVRFMYFVGVATETAVRAEILSRKSDVFLDRTMVATIAYHRAMDVPETWMRIIPRFTLSQLEALLYFTADDCVRQDRLVSREKETGVAMNPNDKASLLLSDKIDTAYRSVIPNRTHVIDTSLITPDQAASQVERILYGT